MRDSREPDEMGVCIEPPEYVIGLRPTAVRRREHVVARDPLGAELQALAPAFVSRARRTSELEQAQLASSPPDEADRDAIDAFLVRAYEEAWRR